VVDGTGGTYTSHEGESLYEVAPYLINHPFAETNITLTASLATWEKFTPKQRELIKSIMLEIESELIPFFDDLNGKALKKMLDGGLQLIEFSPEGAKRYIDICHQGQWGALKAAVDAETFATLKKLLTDP
jgi:TRAP-type C4-dicarboxylate transport system substrate-binding protein